jgi:hypothetical protein
LADEAVVDKLAMMAPMTDLTTRFERVRVFLSHLLEREREELTFSSERGGPFQEPLVGVIEKAVEAEIKQISKKTGGSDRFGG